MNYFSKLRKINSWFLFALLGFAILAAILVSQHFVVPVGIDTDRFLQGVAVLFSIVMVWVGFRIFNKRVLELRVAGRTADERLRGYHRACVAWWTMLELPAFLNVIFFVITGNYAFFVLALSHCAIIFLFRPRMANVMLLLNLTESEFK
jgi:hypothetical protein